MPVFANEPTRITGPLTADGYIDYLKALEERFSPPELATDDNGFRVFVRLFGDVGSREIREKDREFYRLQKYEKLGLDPDVPPPMVFPKTTQQFLEDFYKAKGEEMPPINWACQWTLANYPVLADWVKEIDEPMDAIAEALRKPVFFFPLLQSPEAMQSRVPQLLVAAVLPQLFQKQRLFLSVQQNFVARAGYRIGQGDIDGAIDDKISIMRLGRLFSQRSHVIQYLIGVAIEDTGRSIPVGANPEHPLTEQQIRRILAGLDALPPRPPFSDVYEWERYSVLSAVQWLGKGIEVGVEQPGAGLLDRLSVLFRALRIVRHNWDWDIAYNRVNETFDALHEPPPRENLKAILEVAKAVAEQHDWRFTVRFRLSPEMTIANMIIGLMVPMLEGLEERVQRFECAANMHRLALAILLYRVENGTMPGENWATQIKKYLGENPEQYFSCPSNPSPKGMTTYALVQYGLPLGTPMGLGMMPPPGMPMGPGMMPPPPLLTNPLYVLMLVELMEPVPLDEAVISGGEVLARERTGSLHPDGMNVVQRMGIVSFLLAETDETELRSLLGR